MLAVGYRVRIDDADAVLAGQLHCCSTVDQNDDSRCRAFPASHKAIKYCSNGHQSEFLILL